MQTARYLAAATAILAFAATACKKKVEEPQRVTMVRPRILGEFPALPGAIITDTTGSEDAERRSYLSQVGFDSVQSYYRRMLPAHGFAINGDRGDSVELDLYTRKGEQTVWVHIKRVGPLATEYTIIANGGQSAPADTAR